MYTSSSVRPECHFTDSTAESAATVGGRGVAGELEHAVTIRLGRHAVQRARPVNNPEPGDGARERFYAPLLGIYWK